MFTSERPLNAPQHLAGAFSLARMHEPLDAAQQQQDEQDDNDEA
jgi:hypothetical protein